MNRTQSGGFHCSIISLPVSTYINFISLFFNKKINIYRKDKAVLLFLKMLNMLYFTMKYFFREVCFAMIMADGDKNKDTAKESQYIGKVLFGVVRHSRRRS